MERVTIEEGKAYVAWMAVWPSCGGRDGREEDEGEKLVMEGWAGVL